MYLVHSLDDHLEKNNGPRTKLNALLLQKASYLWVEGGVGGFSLRLFVDCSDFLGVTSRLDDVVAVIIRSSSFSITSLEIFDGFSNEATAAAAAFSSELMSVRELKVCLVIVLFLTEVAVTGGSGFVFCLDK